MSNTEYLTNIINDIEVGKPIYNKELAETMAKDYQIDYKKASRNVAVALNRIIETGAIKELRFYRKGIYYKTTVTPFGEKKINKEELINDKYLKDDEGYDGGNNLLNKIGLTTQMTKDRVIISNYASQCARKDDDLGVIVKPPKVKVTKSNKNYLIILDAINMMDDAPIDVENPYNVIIDYIERYKLAYDELIAYARNYYNNKTILRIADAIVGGKHKYETS